MGRIEEGCMALVVRGTSINVGKIVTVGKFLGKLNPTTMNGTKINFENTKLWEVDQPMTLVDTITRRTTMHLPLQTEHNLQRIDDMDDLEKARIGKEKI